MGKRRVQPSQIQIIEYAEVVVRQGIIRVGGDSLRIGGFGLTEFSLAPQQRTQQVQGLRLPGIDDQGVGQAVLRGLKIVAAGENDRQVDVCPGVVREPEQEFLKAQFGVDRVSGCHRCNCLLI